MHEGAAVESRVREITGDLFDPVTVTSQKPALKITGQLLAVLSCPVLCSLLVKLNEMMERLVKHKRNLYIIL
jgi:hypothetical protein